MQQAIIVIWGVMGPLILIGTIGLIYILYDDKKNRKNHRRR